jgi:hypothetical protein
MDEFVATGELLDSVFHFMEAVSLLTTAIMHIERVCFCMINVYLTVKRQQLEGQYCLRISNDPFIGPGAQRSYKNCGILQNILASALLTITKQHHRSIFSPKSPATFRSREGGKPYANMEYEISCQMTQKAGDKIKARRSQQGCHNSASSIVQ